MKAGELPRPQKDGWRNLAISTTTLSLVQSLTTATICGAALSFGSDGFQVEGTQFELVSRFVEPINGNGVEPLTTLAMPEGQLQSLFRCTRSASPPRRSRSKLLPLLHETSVARRLAARTPLKRPL